MKGLSYPFILSNRSLKLSPVEDSKVSSILIHLGWALDTLPFLDGFGSIIPLLIEEPNSNVVLDLVYFEISNIVNINYNNYFRLEDVKVYRDDSYKLSIILKLLNLETGGIVDLTKKFEI